MASGRDAAAQLPPATDIELELSDCSEESPETPTMLGTLSRGIVVTSVVEDAIGDDDEDPLEPAKNGTHPRRCTPEVKALSLSACLFTTITSFQIYAAYVAHSQALLMDCISSAVDALTFMGNIVVECKKRDGRPHATSQLVVVAMSLGLLSFFTLRAMSGSVESVLVCLESGKFADSDDEDVNGWITLGFALGNMFFDCICLLNFFKSHRQTGSGKHVNMFSAFLHVGADFLRALTTLVMSLVILICTDWDSTCVDASSSLVIGVTILAGVVVGFWKWARLLVSLCPKSQESCQQ